MALQAAMQAGSGEFGDAVTPSSEHIVERQQGAPPELHDHSFLDRGQDRAVRGARSHGCVIDGSPGPPPWQPCCGSDRSAWLRRASSHSTLGARLELAASFGLSREGCLP